MDRHSKNSILRLLAFLLAVSLLFTGCARRGGSSDTSTRGPGRNPPAEETTGRRGRDSSGQNSVTTSIAGLISGLFGKDDDRNDDDGDDGRRPTKPPTDSSEDRRDGATHAPSGKIYEFGSGGKEMSSQKLAAYSESRVGKVVTDTGHGSGFFIDSKGTMVTNYHVIHGASYIEVQFDDGSVYDVLSIIDFAPFYDVAVLQVDISGNDYFYVADDFVQGESVYVRGYPKNVPKASFTVGILSLTTYMMGVIDCITIDAAISTGNSGGPAMNSRGEVLGICSFSRADAQNMNFAIKMSVLDLLDMDKYYTIKEYQDWYEDEVYKSYAAYDGSDYLESFINSYTAVTGVPCLNSFDDPDYMLSGYHACYNFYLYEYSQSDYNRYVSYLESIGFEYQSQSQDQGAVQEIYRQTLDGYIISLAADPESGLLLVSCFI